jgi:DNA polymerase III subunit delta
MSIQALKKELGQGMVRNLYVFYGPEDFLIKKYVKQIQNLIFQKDFKEMNLDILEGKKKPEDIIEACQNMPFFSEKRMILVKETGFFKKVSTGEKQEDGGEQIKKQREVLKNFFYNVPSHVCVVFIEKNVEKTITTLIKGVTEKGMLLDFPYQKPSDLVRWIELEFKNHGIEISRPDAGVLVEYCEPNMTYIDAQMQKLITYGKSKGKITLEDITRICTKALKVIIFDLIDAISEKNVKKAMAYLDDMIEKKEPIQMIYYMIAKQFRLILNVKILQEKGQDQKTIQDLLKLHPFVAGKLWRYAKGFSKDRLKNALRESYEMDILNKNTSLDPRLSAEILIAQFASKG